MTMRRQLSIGFDWLPPAESTAAERPRTWGDCQRAEAERVAKLTAIGAQIQPPVCGWRQCPQWLPHGECTLRLAERGGMTSEEIAQKIGLSRQGVEQIIHRQLRRLADEFPELRDEIATYSPRHRVRVRIMEFLRMPRTVRDIRDHLGFEINTYKNHFDDMLKLGWIAAVDGRLSLTELGEERLRAELGE